MKVLRRAFVLIGLGDKEVPCRILSDESVDSLVIDYETRTVSIFYWTYQNEGEMPLSLVERVKQWSDVGKNTVETKDVRS